MEGESLINYEGVHFLAALDADSEGSDVENGSWASSISEDEAEEPQPKKFCASLEWVQEEVNTINPFPFTGDSGMRYSLEFPEPIDLFNCLCKPEFLDQILTATNKYGRELESVEQGAKWRLLTKPELCQFLGILFHTGTIRMTNLSDYWSSNKLFDIKIFRNMQKDRFLRILSALRFGNDVVDENNKAASLEPAVAYFNYAMNSITYPGRELIVDDCMIVSKGTLTFKDYVNSLFCRPELYLHSLSEPNGLVHKLVVADVVNNTEVIAALMENKLCRGHSLFLGEYYCSLAIVHEMALKRTYCTGILSPHSKLIPEDVVDMKLRKGQSVIRFSEPGICLMKWRATEDVVAVSSEFRNSADNEVNNIKQKPLMVRVFRKFTTGVDRKEFLSSYKPLDGKNLGWYRSVLVQILQLMLKNAYLLYTNHVKKMSLHDYRLFVIENLMTKEKGVELFFSRLPVVEEDVLHVPRKFPKREGQRALRKRCKVCLRDGKRTDSYYHCPSCPNQPALCLEKCFAEYHNAVQDKTNKTEKKPGSDSD